jgi:serine protease
VTVAVIDSGVTAVNATQPFPLWTGSRIALFNIPFRQNPDIAAARFGLSRDFVFWTGPVLDMVGHGTHVAGTVLQETNNSLALAGIASHARLMPLKACVGYWDLQILTSAQGIPGFVNPNETGGCPTAAVVSAIRYAADNGAKIINLSFGSPGASPADLDAVQYAVQRGVFVAMSMGNAYEEGNPIEYPAAYAPQVNGAMSVGAINRSRRRAYYSNTGSHIEVTAPGGDVRDGGLSGVVYQAGLFDPDFDPDTVVVPRFDRYYDHRIKERQWQLLTLQDSQPSSMHKASRILRPSRLRSNGLPLTLAPPAMMLNTVTASLMPVRRCADWGWRDESSQDPSDRDGVPAGER